MSFPTPRTRRSLHLMLLRLLHRPAPSFWSPLSGLDAPLYALTSLPHRTQQFQKNAYHNDKCVISEIMTRPPVQPSHAHPASFIARIS